MDKMLNISELSAADLAGICDHTYLNRAEAFRVAASHGESAVRLRQGELVDFLEGVAASFLKPYGVCVRGEDCAFVRGYLDEHDCSGCKVVSVAGFPDGCHVPTAFKVAEAQLALDAGAAEIDMVMNYLLLKQGDVDGVARDIAAVERVVHAGGGLLKLILETSELTFDEIQRACVLASQCGVDFVKTSTGFSAYGARPEHVTVMVHHFSGGIKISGGVRADNVRELLAAAVRTGDGRLECDPLKIRIGESALLQELQQEVRG